MRLVLEHVEPAARTFPVVSASISASSSTSEPRATRYEGAPFVRYQNRFGPIPALLSKIG